jgi:integrase
MTNRMITELGLRALRPKATYYEVSAGGGLRVGVQPTGHKSFLIRYRFPKGGRSRKLTFESNITLAAARREAAECFYALEKGTDPGVARDQRRQAARLAIADTLTAVVDEYFKREGHKLRTASNRRRTLERLVLPALGDRPIGAIKRSEIIRLLDRVEEKNGAAIAHGTLAYLRKIMNWHAVRDDAFASPIVRGMSRRRPLDHARSRILSDDEICRVWQTAEADPSPFGALVLFLLLTAARRSEASNLMWAEVRGTDWLLPKVRNKTKLDLVRPLSTAAQRVLSRLPRVGEFVFTTNGRQGLGGFQWRKQKFDEQCGVTGWTLHDLRRTARSLMSRAGVNSDHAERCLGHAIGGVRGIYDRHAFHREKQQAFEALAAEIDRIINPPGSNVTVLRR